MCSPDNNIIMSQDDYMESGRAFGFKSDLAIEALSKEHVKRNDEFLSNTNNPGKHPSINYNQKRQQYKSSNQMDKNSQKSMHNVLDKEVLGLVFKSLGITVLAIFGMIALIFIFQCCLETIKVLRGDNSSSTI